MSEPVQHGMFDTGDVRLHYVRAGDGDPLLLIHGFPQTWYQWAHLIPQLSERFTVIAPAYRGAGDSSRPVGGYDKHTMAGDLRALAHELVGDRPVHVLGHDMGSFVAYSYAAHFADEVRSLVIVDTPTLGTPLSDSLLNTAAAWHVHFHSARDVAEFLVSGREREYLRQAFDNRVFRKEMLTPESFEVYVEAYSRPGAMRAAFEAYRAFGEDAEVNRAMMAEHPLPMPVLTVASERSRHGAALADMGRSLGRDVRGMTIPDCQHWIPEEQPALFLAAITEFLTA